MQALAQEMELRGRFLEPSEGIDTIYLGGGTPSQLGERLIDLLFGHIYKVYGRHSRETTVEVNPDDVTPSMAACLAANGVDRVSMGAQTFDDSRLRWLRRRHTAHEVSTAVELLGKAGIRHISVDLMYGFPGQTIEQWDSDICQAIGLGVEHVSAYSLMYEEGTPLYSWLQQKRIEEVDENVSVEMYQTLVRRMKAAGYEHYEISNFAKPGCRAKHNSSYWNDTHYIGLGAAAHSYNGRVRQWNVDNIDTYIQAVGQGRVPAEVETIDPDTHYDDLVTTALRTSDGLSLDWLEPRYRDFILRAAQPYLDDQRMERIAGRLRITEKGVMVSDMIMSDLMIVDD